MPKYQAKCNVYLIGGSIRWCLIARDISLDPADVNMHGFGIKLFIDSHIDTNRHKYCYSAELHTGFSLFVCQPTRASVHILIL